MIEVVPRAEDQRVTEEPVLEPWPGDSGYEAASLAPFAGDGGEPVPAAAPDREEVREAAPAPTAESEQGVPFVSETERVLEEAVAAPANSADNRAGEAPASSEPASPNEDVLTVTDKPANPRRGWWQRLVQ